MQIIHGVNPVMEALKSNSSGIKKIVVANGKSRANNIRKILELADQKRVDVEFREIGYIERLAGGKTHQGIVSLCKEYPYSSIEEIIDNRHKLFKESLILILDGITDPQNLGSLIRTAHCYGANGVIIPSDRAVSITSTVIKASAGAVYHIPIAMVVNIARTIDCLKEKRFWIYGADARQGQDIYSVDYDGNIGLVMGSEGRGIRPLVRKRCDFFVSIPILGKVDSLNVSVAAGVILHEITRKKLRYADLPVRQTCRQAL